MPRNKTTYQLAKYVYTPDKSLAETFKKNRTKQYTTLFIRTYTDEASFLDFLRALPCDAWSYIVHDKDTTPDGQSKETHIHAILHFPPDGRIRLTTICRWATQNTLVELPISVQDCYDYLLHANSPEKYQYDSCERKSHNTDVLLGSRSSYNARREEAIFEKNASFIQDLLNLNPYDMALKYGRDYIKNFERYSHFGAIIADTPMLTPEEYGWLRILSSLPREASKYSCKLFCNALYCYLTSTPRTTVNLDMNILLDALSKSACLLNLED